MSNSNPVQYPVRQYGDPGDTAGWEKLSDTSSEAYINFSTQYPGLDSSNSQIQYDNNFTMNNYDVYYNSNTEQYYINGNGFTYTDASGNSQSESSFMAFLPKENVATNSTYIKYSGTGSMTEDESALIHQAMTGSTSKDQITIISGSTSKSPDRTLTFANQLSYTKSSTDGITKLATPATKDGMNVVNRNGSVTIAGFSGGAVTSYKTNMELLKNKNGGYTNLSLVDPGSLRSCPPLLDVNNAQEVEDAKLLSNSTVVVYTRINTSNTSEGAKYNPNDDMGSGWQDRADYKVIAKNCKDFYIFEAKLEFDYNGNGEVDKYSSGGEMPFDDRKFGIEHVLQNNINNTNIALHGSVINSEYDLSMYNLYKPIVDPKTGEITYKLVDNEEERAKIIQYLTMKDKIYRDNPSFMNNYDDLKTKISDLRIFCKSFIDNATAELETLTVDNKSIISNKSVGAYRSTASTIKYSDLIIAIDYYTNLTALLNTIENTVSFIDYIGLEKEEQEKVLTGETERLGD